MIVDFSPGYILFGIFVFLIACILEFKSRHHDKNLPSSKINFNNGTIKVRWEFPDDQILESKIKNPASFIQVLRNVNSIAFDSLHYKVSHIELMMGDEYWISIILE